MISQISNQRKYLSLLLNLLFLLSCNKTINNPMQHFDKIPKKELNHSHIINLEKFDILKPIDAIRINNSYMIWDNKNENIFNLIDPISNKVIKGVNIGNGPNEIISPSSFQNQDGKFLIYDISQRRINQIDISSDTTLIIKKNQEINTNKRLFVINRIGSNIIATGILEDYWLANMTTDGEITSGIEFPAFEETNNTPKVQLSMLYISTLMANTSDNKKVVAVTQKHGVVSFLNYINNSILNEYKQIKYYAPNFTIEERGNIAFSKNNQVGFCGVDCDNDYVYALYSGKTFAKEGMLNHHCENLLIYDWNGNPIKHYVLDIPLYSMRYNEKNNLIYGIAYYPEGILVEYQLDD
ncbi:hypothetical protein D7D25_16315 [Proteiniphilum sp. X52]|nr:hypothetical protein D7D25_16315 [Proteiniphilum sp. X52]